jgi:hypothetical protein
VLVAVTVLVPVAVFVIVSVVSAPPGRVRVVV